MEKLDEAKEREGRRKKTFALNIGSPTVPRSTAFPACQHPTLKSDPVDFVGRSGVLAL